MKKIVKNHFGKVITTGEASTILDEGEIQHPAAKLVVAASKLQAEQIGDGTNFVVVFAGALLGGAIELFQKGLHGRDVVVGYERAHAYVEEILPQLATNELVFDPLDLGSVQACLRTSLSSHQPGDCELLARLAAEACVNAWRDQTRKFNTDNVRVAKALGGSVGDSFFVRGFCVQRECAGTVRRVADAHVALFATSFDLVEAETKTNTVFRSGEEMAAYVASRETRMEEIVGSIAAAGVNVVVCQSKITELALHFLDKYGIMAIQLPSAWDVKRLSRACGAMPLLRVGAPTAEEIGACSSVEIRDIGSTPIAVFEAAGELSTIVVRGSTPMMLDDIERDLDDAVNTFQVLTRYPAFVAGGGAAEAELGVRLEKMSEGLTGMDQYGVKKFGEALLAIPKALARNAGLRVSDVLAKLRAAHHRGDQLACIDTMDLGIGDAVKLGVFDVLHVKVWAIKLAVEVAATVLRVDSVCVAKAAIGPQPRKPGSRDEE